MPGDDKSWHCVKTSDEAIEFLKHNIVEHLSLDFDLGFTQMERVIYGTGYDVVAWLDKNRNNLPYIVELHTHNDDGRWAMLTTLINIGYARESRSLTRCKLPISIEEWRRDFFKNI